MGSRAENCKKRQEHHKKGQDGCEMATGVVPACPWPPVDQVRPCETPWKQGPGRRTGDSGCALEASTTCDDTSDGVRLERSASTSIPAQSRECCSVQCQEADPSLPGCGLGNLSSVCTPPFPSLGLGSLAPPISSRVRRVDCSASCKLVSSCLLCIFCGVAEAGLEGRHAATDADVQ